jgi:hypothetical protein
MSVDLVTIDSFPSIYLRVLEYDRLIGKKTLACVYLGENPSKVNRFLLILVGLSAFVVHPAGGGIAKIWEFQEKCPPAPVLIPWILLAI